MSAEKQRPSRRFNPSTLTERLVPLVLSGLFLALLATLVVILLSVLGLTPAA